jgi:regulator of RNase E activity RraA
MKSHVTAVLALWLLPGCVYCQSLPEPETRTHEIPAWVAERLSPEDRRLFNKLIRLELESLWGRVVAEGYPNCFINELEALKPQVRMVGRARTIRYLPNRKDLRAKLYAARPQLNYVSSEDAQPGDVLVFEAGGETRSAVTGNVTGTRLAYRGGVGMVADGAFRDVPALNDMHLQIYMRRGQAAGVAPVQMSVDYQVPVRIGGVTVVPGDILFGERHGILVIPADIVEKVADGALATVEREEFQRLLLMNGEPLFNVYPKLNEANQKRFEEYRKKKPR